MSRIGDLNDIRAMGQVLKQAMGEETVNPWPGEVSKPITRVDDIREPWPGVPAQGMDRVPASKSRGAQAARQATPEQQFRALSPEQQKKVRTAHHEAAKGNGIINPWGPQPPKTSVKLPGSGL